MTAAATPKRIAAWAAPTTEREARVELAAAYRMAFDLGWTDLGATHFSLAVPGEPAYLMIELGRFFDEVTASNLVKVGFDGTVHDERGGVEVNPAGVTIHAAVHASRNDVAAALHTHTPAGVAMANHPDGVLPLSQHALRFYDGFGVHPYEGVALDGAEGPRLAADLGGHELLLLANHGLLTVGVDLPQAFSALYYAEMAAQIQLATLSTTDSPAMPSPQTCAHTRTQYDASVNYTYRDWAGIMRHVHRHHPGFDQ